MDRSKKVPPNKDQTKVVQVDLGMTQEFPMPNKPTTGMPWKSRIDISSNLNLMLFIKNEICAMQ
jgi:predicted secreted protein